MKAIEKMTNEELFDMIMDTNKKVRKAMYSGNDKALKMETVNFEAQFKFVRERNLVDEYKVYVERNMQEVSAMAHGYKVIVKFADGSEDMVFEYQKEKVADSVVQMYARQSCVALVMKEEF